MKKKIIIVGLSFALMTGCGSESDSLEQFETSNQDEVYNIISEIRNDEREAHFDMLVFPDEQKDYQDAYLYEENYGLSTAHQIVVAKEYDDEGFETEFRRLLASTYDGRHSYYTEDQFKFPAVVYVYNHNNCFEYALLDSTKKQVVYVCNTFLDNMDFIKEAYRPLNYEELSKDNRTDYSIYNSSK